MKHEKFRLFPVPIFNSEISESLTDFLEGGHVTIKSISVAPIDDDYGIISIGYTESKSEQKFELVVNNLGPYLTYRTDEIESALEEIAGHLKGVICQDISIVDGELFVTFLVHKKEQEQVVVAD